MNETAQWLQLVTQVVGFAAMLFAVGKWQGRVTAEMKNHQDALEALRTAVLGPDGSSGPFFRQSEARFMESGFIQRNAATDSRLDDISRRLGALEARE